MLLTQRITAMNSTHAPFWERFLPGIFPLFEELLEPCLESHMRVIAALELVRPENWIPDYSFSEKGRPKIERAFFVRAFMAKAILNI